MPRDCTRFWQLFWMTGHWSVKWNGIDKTSDFDGHYATNPQDTPDSKVHGANMGPIWGRQDKGGPHVGPMNFTIWEPIYQCTRGQLNYRGDNRMLQYILSNDPIVTIHRYCFSDYLSEITFSAISYYWLFTPNPLVQVWRRNTKLYSAFKAIYLIWNNLPYITTALCT